MVGRNPTDRPKSNGAELETRLDAYTKAANDHIASGSTGMNFWTSFPFHHVSNCDHFFRLCVHSSLSPLSSSHHPWTSI